jgi:hypothetical protein
MSVLVSRNRAEERWDSAEVVVAPAGWCCCCCWCWCHVNSTTTAVTVALGDFNSDGRPDIAAAVDASGEVVVLRNRPAGGGGSPDPGGGDGDGDGRLDRDYNCPADSNPAQ